MRIILAALVALAVANLVLGHWTVGLSLIVSFAAAYYLTEIHR